ncbi:MAG: hypothetical protein HYY15_03670 [Candidatus Omnitrophica bacterium]|nr:hypothetical protein [Candidatus Omnitrophota bacterium]
MSIGLEIGPSSVRAVRLARQGSAIQVVGLAHAAWSGSADELISVLKHVRRTLPIRAPVVLGVPSAAAIVTTVSPLLVSRRRAAAGLAFELQQQLPYDVAQAAWSAEWLNGGGGQHPGLAPAVVSAMKQDLLAERLRLCQRAGIAVRSVQVTAIAAANVWLQEHRTRALPRGILVMVDQGAIEWIIVAPQSLQVFSALAPAASGPPGAGGEPAWAEALQASWEGVQTALGSAEAGEPAAPDAAGAKTVWILSSPVPPALLMERLRCVCAGYTIDVVDPARAGIRAFDLAQHADATAAMGLALHGAGLGRLPTNLLGRMQRAQRNRQIAQAGWAVAILGAMLAAGLTARGMMTIVRAKEDRLGQLAGQERVYQQSRQEVRTMLQRHQRLEARLQQLEALSSRRRIVSDAVRQVVAALPEDAWLTKLEFTKSEALEGVLEGHARSFQSVTRLIEQLKSAGSWAVVKPLATTVSTDAATGNELIDFTVQMQSVPTLEPPKKPTIGRSPSRAPAAAPAARSRPGVRPAPRPSRPAATPEQP